MRHRRLVLLLLLLVAPVSARLEGDTASVAAKDRATLLQLLKSVSLQSATVTSVERTPKHQTRVMYDLAKKDREAALDMYCAAGDAVLEKYDARKSKEQNLKVMEKELITQLPHARELGCLNHIKNDEVYAVDIGVSEIPKQKHAAFIEAAKRAKKAKKLVRFLYPPRDPEAFHFEFKRAAPAQRKQER